MGKTTLKWIKDRQFVGIDSTNHSVVISTPMDGVGMKPSDLLLLALASCTAVDVVDILRKMRMPISFMEISTEGEQDEDPPWTFRKFHLHFKLDGQHLTHQAVEQAIQLSEEKYCAVASTVRATAEISTTFELLSKESAPAAE